MRFGARGGHSQSEPHHTQRFPAGDQDPAPTAPRSLPNPKQRDPRRRTPETVRLAALLLYLFAAVCVLLAVGVIGANQGEARLADSLPAPVAPGGLGTVVALLALAFGVAAVATRLRRRRRWAWLLVTGISMVTLVFAVIAFAAPEPASGGVAIPALMAVLLLVLLNTRQARGWYR